MADKHWKIASAGLLALGIAAALLGLPDAPARPQNLVLIVIDTLRWDRVSAYGAAAHPTTPAIDAVAASGVRFERAYSAAPWTMPSVATILTGMYPGQHGLTAIPQALARSRVTLAEILSARGYRTGAVISHLLLKRKHGFSQGFDRYDQSAAAGKIHEKLTTPEVTEAALGMVTELADGEAPFFLMVHYFDPHYSYRPHPELGFAPGGVGRLDGYENISQLRAMSLTEPERGFIQDLYDGEVRYTDEGVSRLLTQLDTLGLRGDTVVAVTADHGEAFLEHGWLGHTRDLYEELVRVPLVIRAPGVPPGVIHAPVSLVSLTPTLLSLLGVEDLSPWPFETGPLSLTDEPAPGPCYFEVDFAPPSAHASAKRSHKKGIVLGDSKVILDQSDGSYQSFDLAADPQELAPAAADPALAALLDTSIARISGETAPTPSVEVSDEEIEKLKRLGYLR